MKPKQTQHNTHYTNSCPDVIHSFMHIHDNTTNKATVCIDRTHQVVHHEINHSRHISHEEDRDTPLGTEHTRHDTITPSQPRTRVLTFFQLRGMDHGVVIRRPMHNAVFIWFPSHTRMQAVYYQKHAIGRSIGSQENVVIVCAHMLKPSSLKCLLHGGKTGAGGGTNPSRGVFDIRRRRWQE